jgi:tight adherence protein C
MTLAVGVCSGLTGLGLLVFFWALSRPQAVSVDRIRADLILSAPNSAPTVEDVEFRRPFTDRFLRPPIERLSRWLANQTPRHILDNLEVRLAIAGQPLGLHAADYMAIRYVVALLLIVAGLVFGLLFGDVLGAALGFAAGAALGYLLPAAWLAGIARRRRRRIIRELPDAIDLLTIGVEAGLALDFAMSRIVDRMHNPLADEMGLALRQIQLGRSRAEALEEMAARSGVEEIHGLVQAIIQSEQMGVGIAKVLHAQASEIRRRRRQKVQLTASRASLKMLFPMVGCIFPSIWIVLLGPGLLILLKNLD